jgi:hypothetical protein
MGGREYLEALALLRGEASVSERHEELRRALTARFGGGLRLQFLLWRFGEME